MKKFRLSPPRPELAAGRLTLAASAASLLAFSAAATDTIDLSSTVAPIVSLIHSFLPPLLAVVLVVSPIYCILLCFSYISAKQPKERENALQHLKSAVVGFAMIFIFLFLLNVGTRVMVSWINNSTGMSLSIPGLS